MNSVVLGARQLAVLEILEAAETRDPLPDRADTAASAPDAAR